MPTTRLTRSTISTISTNSGRRRLSTGTTPDNYHQDDDKFRILYIVTSGGKAYKTGPSLRWETLVEPVLLESVADIMSTADAVKPRNQTDSRNSEPIHQSQQHHQQQQQQQQEPHPALSLPWHVDVYLVLGYTMEEQTKQHFQEALHQIHPNISLQVWTEALPMMYSCDTWESTFKDVVGHGTTCRDLQLKRNNGNGQQQASLHLAKAQLARQHRYVVKDQLSNYDFFLAFEDDMLIRKHHIIHHLDWTWKLHQWKTQVQQHSNQSIDEQNQQHQVFSQQNTSHNLQQELTWQQMERMKPGWIRVEVLGDERRYIPTEKDDIDVPVYHTEFAPSWNNPNQTLDPNLCCQRPQHLGRKTTLPILSSDLVLWETGILGMGVRTFLDYYKQTKDDPTWIALLPGPTGSMNVPQYWSGHLQPSNQQQQPRPRPRPGDASLIAQSAGWMASPHEIMEYHTQFCRGGFLPPFDLPKYILDGLYRNNVEYWSGGIQLWAGTCQIPRFLVLEELEKHFLYHTSNNKQSDPRRIKNQVRAVTLQAQLHRVRTAAEELLLLASSTRTEEQEQEQMNISINTAKV